MNTSRIRADVRHARRAPALRIAPAFVGLVLLAAAGEDDPRAARLREEMSRRPDAVAHWAWKTPARPPLPKVQRSDWPRNEVDRFVLAALEAEGLQPSPEADRETLIRRLSIALAGLPPTPEAVIAFATDERDEAVEELVDHLLASPAYAERMATAWLDLARYADSMGYAQDEPRDIWRYRDWVISAFSDNMPFDRFTIEQLAGDLLPDPTDDQQIATAFHRNTMTNSEGGTDDEEFRVAAVIDRTNTTLTVWNGVTIGCAQCHDHKTDPISQREYYELSGFFNQTEDADRADDAPVILSPSVEQRSQLAEVDERVAALRREIDHRVDQVEYRAAAQSVRSTGPQAPTAGDPIAQFVWVDDALPPGAASNNATGATPWPWVDVPLHPARGGTRSTLILGGPSEYQFTVALGLPLASSDVGDAVVFADVQLHGEDPPRAVGLRAITDRGDARAYLGDESPFKDGGGQRIGPIPAAGEWQRMEIPLTELGLAGATELRGLGFANSNGNCWFDTCGLIQPAAWVRSQPAWEAWERRRSRPDLPGDIQRGLRLGLVAEDEDEDEDEDDHPTGEAMRRYFIEWIHGPSRGRFERLHGSLAAVQEQREELRGTIPTTPVMRALPPDARRATHVLSRGNFLSPGILVDPDVPAILPPLREGEVRDRLALARWLVDPDHPLTARVLANRLWELLFGTGIVLTSEDFGVTGEPPTHPELLDWLATEMIRLDWDVKAFLKLIATSATFRQSSDVPPALAAIDLDNRKLARGPALRLDAEMIRDQALFVSGLLDTTLFGPPVRPHKPDSGLKAAFGGETDWVTSPGTDAWRRSLYTLRRRTAPYPTYSIFDSPSREFCVVRRARSNTPLQALATMNDPVFVETAQALARRMVREGGGEQRLDQTLAAGFVRCVGREPDDEETTVLRQLFQVTRSRFAQHPAAAAAAATDPLGEIPDDLEESPIALAAWTQVAAVLLNLDETLTRR